VASGSEIDCVGWVNTAWIEAGLPTCRWNSAPAGHGPVAALRRRSGGWLHAWLYRLDLATEKRAATPAVLAALEAAMRARRTCPTCERDTGCCIPRSLGECWDCHQGARARVAAQHPGHIEAAAAAGWAVAA